MKKIKKYISLAIIGGTMAFFTSCNDFLERDPLDGFTDQNYWTSEANVKTYAWKFYNQFKAYGIGTGTTAEFFFQSAGATTCANFSDDITANSYLPYQPNPSSSNTEWRDNYEYINRANIMLEKIPTVPMTDEAKNHWEGVARFYRALAYYKLVQRFGDVPYYDKRVTDINNVQVVYLPRTSRSDVMDKVREDINKAVTLLREADEANSVNKYVGLALKARIGLYEGTYRKYHNAGDGKVFLQDAKSAAEDIIASTKFKLVTGADAYQSVYNSEDLSKNSEMILYKSYILGVQANSIQAYTNTSTVVNGMTKAAFENYVCADGLPISQSPLYTSTKDFQETLKNRDPRLLAAVEKEGISFRGSDKSLSRSRKSSTGYVISLFYNSASPNITTTGQNTIDAPIFSYAEVLLNYAEASAELKEITQADLDKSINLLRARAGIKKLTYVTEDNVQVDGVTINDPKRTSVLENKTGAVSSIIWEIRRERRAELMTWTELRYYDLMRWKKGDYLDYTSNPDVALGAYLDKSKLSENEKKNITLNDDGYIKVYPSNNRVFDAGKNYLNSIPTGQIDLYKGEGVDLPQNPGWNK
ncbi:RagB/SusD family nutrient uptake outer membrane protein [Dysgonomonas sp. 37-18]|uniref:RagB/SusD family nutrient uptake outer membrane protein n=1 Tax=Dysgonomonas sp. 37-18 TaxID=1895907 RepID=UPI00092B59FE|nr:RagB/SusD family nutrient uptake outer membrane protein [Dysgonomonas sp. 37-18]OJX58368.1 MAG: hypothetical protein BGO84_04830 [Dysgonomonas sp. 37-18]